MHLETIKTPDPWVLLDHPHNPAEKELERVEAAWADFAHGARDERHLRMVRSSTRPTVRFSSLLTVHEVLSMYQSKAAAGDQSACWHALTLCAAENVPLPYWLGDAVLAIDRATSEPGRAGTKPRNLHQLFGLEVGLPSSASRGNAARVNLQKGVQLMRAIAGLIGIDPNHPRMPETAAIKEAAKVLGLSQSAARRLYLKQKARQQEHLDILSNTKRHRL
jgi:hypothetical protein